MLMCVTKVTAITELTTEVRAELYLIWLTHNESHWAVTASMFLTYRSVYRMNVK